METEETTSTPTVESSAYTRAIRNILEDFGEEKERLKDTQKAILNILGDFGEEKERLEGTQKAFLNILEDSGEEKARLAGVQKALLNILEDFDLEKQRLVHATAELARSNAELEQFAYVASHDLQEPLRMVSAYVQLFEKRFKGHIDDQADKYIHYAVDGAKRMEALIGALLDYSRAGRTEIQTETVDAERVLERVLSTLKGATEESRALVTHDPLPAVRSDETQLARVLQNLLGNALKFRRPGVPPRVHVSAVHRPKEYVFSVRDNGIGIDSAYADRLFVIFQRLHTRREYPGTGIGLAICKKIVERLGGVIWLESEPGEGTTFFFTLPAADTSQ